MITKKDKEFIDSLENNRKQNKKGLGIQRYIIEFLIEFVRAKKITKILETGICYGFSSAAFLYALPENGKLVSIEAFPKPENELVVPDWLKHKWVRIHEPSTSCLETALAKLQPQLFWHDSLHSYENQYFEYSSAGNAKVTYIGSHDINHSGAWGFFLSERNHKLLLQQTHYAMAEI